MVTTIYEMLAILLLQKNTDLVEKNNQQTKTNSVKEVFHTFTTRSNSLEWLRNLIETLNIINKEVAQMMDAMVDTIPGYMVNKVKRFSTTLKTFQTEWTKTEYQSVILVGRNGVGKSFFLNLIARNTMQSYSPTDPTELSTAEKDDMNTIYHQLFHDLAVHVC